MQGSEKCPYGKDKEEKKHRGGGGGEMQKGKKRKMEIALFFRLVVCTFVVPCNRSKQQSKNAHLREKIAGGRETINLTPILGKISFLGSCDQKINSVYTLHCTCAPPTL